MKNAEMVEVQKENMGGLFCGFLGSREEPRVSFWLIEPMENKWPWYMGNKKPHMGLEPIQTGGTHRFPVPN